jgi:D-cysteine desulfhydrase
VDQRLEAIAGEARAAGRVPYVIPESGATVVGALGYLTCAQEIAEQVRHGAPRFDSIVITAFSGGSHAGLLMGAQVTGFDARIVSVPIAWEATRVREYVTDVIAHAARRYGLPVAPPSAVELIDGYQGAGRAEVRREELDTVLRIARTEGLVFDPVYTGKAFGALLETLRREPGRLGRRVCFIHTGGIFSLFPFRGALRELVDAEDARRRW